MSATRKRRTTNRARTRRTTTRRTTPTVATTFGTALGTLVVAALLNASWPVRLLLVAAVVVVGLGNVLWTHRAEIAVMAEPASGTPTSASIPDPEQIP